MNRTNSYFWVPCSFVALALAAAVAAQLSSPYVQAQGTTNRPGTVRPTEPGQTPPAQPGRTANMMDRSREQSKLSFKASDISDLNVYSAENKEIGKIKDLMVREDGKVVYAAVSFGGFLGMGDKLFAVPWDAVHLVKSPDPNDARKVKLHAQIDVNEATLKNKAGFDKDHWPEEGDNSFLPTGMTRRTAPTSTPSPSR
jgi:sporulation protein YlmC with PRC-barrel domain